LRFERDFFFLDARRLSCFPSLLYALERFMSLLFELQFRFCGSRLCFRDFNKSLLMFFALSF
jgi:hypothetical protein